MQEPCASKLEESAHADLSQRLDSLEARARESLLSRGFEEDQITVQRFLNLRFKGTDVALMTACESVEDYEQAFLDSYYREFGFVLEDRAIIVDDVRCAATRLQ